MSTDNVTTETICLISVWSCSIAVLRFLRSFMSKYTWSYETVSVLLEQNSSMEKFLLKYFPSTTWHFESQNNLGLEGALGGHRVHHSAQTRVNFKVGSDYPGPSLHQICNICKVASLDNVLQCSWWRIFLYIRLKFPFLIPVTIVPFPFMLYLQEELGSNISLSHNR